MNKSSRGETFLFVVVMTFFGYEFKLSLDFICVISQEIWPNHHIGQVEDRAKYPVPTENIPGFSIYIHFQEIQHFV